MAKSALTAMPLAQAIDELRRNISEAAATAAKESLKFKVETVELELTVVATKEGTGGSEVSFGVLGVGVKGNIGGKLSDAATHKVKLVLKPSVDGRDVDVSARKD